jgi:signal transduction histidine kinase
MPFRMRLFAMLLLFAVLPATLVTALWLVTTSRTLPLVGAFAAWERVGASGEHLRVVLDSAPLTEAQQEALRAHETELRASVAMAKRVAFLAPRTGQLIAVGALIVLVVVAYGASRSAGHLARQLSRPLDELIGWTERIRSGVPLPPSSPRGAPEFEVLRRSMRRMAGDLEQGRVQALAAERSEAFRESARRFAHELKNPLTPIRFAVDRLRRSSAPPTADTIDVLTEETARLEQMAAAFAQYGRLPDGAPSAIDVGDLVARTATAAVPDSLQLRLQVAPNLPLLHGYYDALSRAVSNVVRNAVEASPAGGTITVVVRPSTPDELADAVCIVVRDDGPGLSTDVASRIFDPYVTTKAGGTGLGLAIVRQTLAVHGGDVRVTATPGQGAEFRLLLPVQGAAPTPTAAGAVAPTLPTDPHRPSPSS